jgi:Tol biopolymer transport system component
MTTRHILAAALLLPLVPSTALAQVTARASLSTAGVPTDAATGPTIVSGDGRFVFFTSAATNLVAGDTNAVSDVFVRDRLLATTERVSVSTAGVQGDQQSGHTGSQLVIESAVCGLACSSDGRYVVFESNAENLVPGDTNARTDIFLRDRVLGTTERVSLTAGGAQCGSDCTRPSVSDDGRFVTFQSNFQGIVAGDLTSMDVFLRDRALGSTFKVSLANGGGQGNNNSEVLGGPGALSNDGRYVVFRSLASTLVAGDTNGTWDAFVHDRATLTTTRVSVNSSGVQSNSAVNGARMSADGRFVAFSSNAPNLAPGLSGFTDVFVRDLLANTTVCASVSPVGVPVGGFCSTPFLSRDGRYVSFDSAATNVVSGDTNSRRDVFVRDLATGSNRCASRSSSGAFGTQESYAGSVSDDGRYSAFWSLASNFATGDANARFDAFVNDRGPETFVTFCTAGTSSNGCVAALSAVGAPSATAGAGFTLTANSVEGQKQGLLFYGLDNTGFAPLPWGASSSFLCIKSPIQRSTPVASGGAAGACNGSLALDWNTLAVTPGVLGQPFTAGQHVFSQAWYRDPPSPKTTALSDALEFVVEP